MALHLLRDTHLQGIPPFNVASAHIIEIEHVSNACHSRMRAIVMSQQCIRQVEICAWAEGGKAMLKNEVSRPGSNSLDFVSLRFVNIHK